MDVPCTQIHPAVEWNVTLPMSGERCRAVDWAMPGLWTMARVQEENTGAYFWCDLPYSWGLYAPTFIDERTGAVERPNGSSWIADITRRAWANRASGECRIDVIEKRRVSRVYLINCLSPWWGDQVSLLMRVNTLLRSPGFGVVMLVPKGAAYLVPDSVAEAWVVSSADKENVGDFAQWNDALAGQIKQLCRKFDQVVVPAVHQPAWLRPSEVEAYSRIRPFDREQWDEQLATRPRVTFGWRSVRGWEKPGSLAGRTARLLRRLRLHRQLDRWLEQEQFALVLELFQTLRQKIPNLDCCVIGTKRAFTFPAWVTDLRQDRVSPEINLEWYRACAQSHLVIGPFGSNLILPSAHAGAVIELVPDESWITFADAIIMTERDPRMSVFLYRKLALTVAAKSVARLAGIILLNYTQVRGGYADEYDVTRHPEKAPALASLLERRARLLAPLRKTAGDWML